jgi:tetratricopeptide (TPR) repeat protein
LIADGNGKEEAVFELKRLSSDAVPAALDRAERYRLLGEPMEAESICEDVLAVDPGNARARIVRLLAVTDLFPDGPALARARAMIGELPDEYSRAYYRGLVAERAAKALLRRTGPAVPHAAYGLFRDALDAYDRACQLAPPDNNEAVLRWNTCVRILRAHPELAPEAGAPEVMLDAHVDE